MLKEWSNGKRKRQDLVVETQYSNTPLLHYSNDSRDLTCWSDGALVKWSDGSSEE